MTIRTLLWIDGLAALAAGMAVLCLRGMLSNLFRLQEEILIIQAIITLVYASYSTTLAKNKIYPKKLIRILAIANFTYVAFCLGLFINTFATTTVWGKVYFIAEATFISALAILECRQLKYLK